MDDGDKLERASMHRGEGNTLFKVEAYEHALKKYEVARIYVREVKRPLTSAEREELQVPILINAALSMVKGRIASTSEVLSVCDEAVRESAACSAAVRVKALYVRALTRRRRGADLELAAGDLKEALKLSPNNKAVVAEFESLRSELSAALDNEKRMFSRAFAQPPAAVTNPAANGAVEKSANTQAADKAAESPRAQKGEAPAAPKRTTNAPGKNLPGPATTAQASSSPATTTALAVVGGVVAFLVAAGAAAWWVSTRTESPEKAASRELAASLARLGKQLSRRALN